MEKKKKKKIYKKKKKKKKKKGINFAFQNKKTFLLYKY